MGGEGEANKKEIFFQGLYSAMIPLNHDIFQDFRRTKQARLLDRSTSYQGANGYWFFFSL